MNILQLIRLGSVEADRIVNVPKLKAHRGAGRTYVLKNLVELSCEFQVLWLGTIALETPDVFLSKDPNTWNRICEKPCLKSEYATSVDRYIAGVSQSRTF